MLSLCIRPRFHNEFFTTTQWTASWIYLWHLSWQLAMPAHKGVRVVLLGWWLINRLLYFFRIISQTGVGPAKKDKVSTLIKIGKLSFHIPFQNNVNPELKINLGRLPNVMTGQENFSSVTTSLTSKQKHEVKKILVLSKRNSVNFFFCSVIYVSGQNVPWVPEAFHAWFPLSVKC